MKMVSKMNLGRKYNEINEQLTDTAGPNTENAGTWILIQNEIRTKIQGTRFDLDDLLDEIFEITEYI